MRLKGSNKTVWLWALAFIGFLALVLGFIMRDGTTERPRNEQSYFCGAEKVEGVNFVSNGVRFSNGACQSTEKAFSGKHSCRCDADQVYGFGLTFNDLVPGDTLIYSVRRFPAAGPGALVFSSSIPEIFQKKTIGVSQRKGWDLIVDTIVLPRIFENDRTLVYPFYTGEGANVYFDDLNVEVRSVGRSDSEQAYEGSSLGIQLTKGSLDRLKAKRDEARERGLLFTSKEDLVPASMKIDGKDYNVKLRLKGDLLDHLQGDFWSYRIILKNGEEWNGMSQFSIHNSRARSHVAEWLMHEIFRREGIITPRYDFITVESNGKDLGVYAYEHYFEDQMLVDNGRQVAPIFRHNDEAYWSNVQKELKGFSWVRSAEVESMNASDRQGELHVAGRTMLTNFLRGEKDASDVFDLDLMARYFALLNLSHSNHAQLITNIRFYLNPFTGLLEPIAYDCFGSDLPPVTRDWTSIGEGMNVERENTKLYEEGYLYEVELFKNKEFYQKFLHYSYLYNSPEYIDSIMVEFDDALFARRNFIRQDPKYSNYNFSWEAFTKKGRYTYDKLLPKPYLSLKPFYTNEERTAVRLECYHYFPIEVVGFGNDKLEYEIDEPLILEAFNDKVPADSKTIRLAQGARYVYFRTLGIDSLFREKISTQITATTQIDFVKYNVKELQKHEFLDVGDKVITFKPGYYEVNTLIAIPEAYTVVIPSGTTIRFVDAGGIISQSPILAEGSPGQPIAFIGSKNGQNGIAVVNASGKSVFKHCEFSEMSGINQANVQADGALVVYESSIELEVCLFQGIPARDAFKLVNSTGKVDSARFFNCQGDAIDMDQSSLELYSIDMERVGQDGIEIDGGNLLANHVKIRNCFQHGLRVRGRTSTTIYGLVLENSENGVIASDGAHVKLFNPVLQTVQNGFAVESTEFVRSSIHASNLTYSDVVNLYLIDISSELIINDSKKQPL